MAGRAFGSWKEMGLEGREEGGGVRVDEERGGERGRGHTVQTL